MNYLILTEFSKSTGQGHLNRCIALCENLLSEKGSHVCMVIERDSFPPESSLPCPVIKFDWKNPKNLLNLKRELKPFLTEDAFVTYIDSYHARPLIYELFSKMSESLICIDDYNRIIYPSNSTILNPGYSGLFIAYDLVKYKILTGKQSALLRSPFREKFSIPTRHWPPKDILITLGAFPPLDKSVDILEMLSNNFPEIRKHFVLGKESSLVTTLKSHADMITTFYSDLSAKEMRDLVLRMDFAITAGGQTLYELDICGVPFSVTKTAENQTFNIRGFEIFDNANQFDSVSELNLLLRKPMLRKATTEDSQLFFTWANDPSVRAASFNSNEIEHDTHCQWFQSKLKSDGTLMLVLVDFDGPIGQIRFDLLGESSVFLLSFSIDELRRGRSYGKIIVKEGIRYLRHWASSKVKVIAKVKKGNVPSQRTFEDIHFKLVNDEEDVLTYEFVSR